MEPLQFKIIDRLGRGQFSTVYKAKWLNAPPQPDECTSGPELQQPPAFVGHGVELVSGPDEQQQQRQQPNERLVALKRIELCEIPNSEARTDYLKEVKLLQQVKHKNIINFNISFIERNELFIVLELADGGDLSKLIRYFQRKKRLISEQTILKYFTQVSSAVEYIHSKRILHRDIKPANIFMTSDGCVKLGDFGLGRFFSQNTRDAHSIVGTFYYMSPERIRESGYSFSSDVWSLGCVLYELITLNSPFSIFNQQQQPTIANHSSNNEYNLQWLFERITRAEYPSLDGYAHISGQLRSLAGQCLNPSPELRPRMAQICPLVYEAYRRASGARGSPPQAQQAQPQPQPQAPALGHSASPIQQQCQPQHFQQHPSYHQFGEQANRQQQQPPRLHQMQRQMPHQAAQKHSPDQSIDYQMQFHHNQLDGY